MSVSGRRPSWPSPASHVATRLRRSGLLRASHRPSRMAPGTRSFVLASVNTGGPARNPPWARWLVHRRWSSRPASPVDEPRRDPTWTKHTSVPQASGAFRPDSSTALGHTMRRRIKGRGAVIQTLSRSGSFVLPNSHFCQIEASAGPFPDGNLCPHSSVTIIGRGATVSTIVSVEEAGPRPTGGIHQDRHPAARPPKSTI